MDVGSEMNYPRVLIGAPASGQGKTTVSLGVMRALARKGLAVQPFKVGPDYIDPGHHARAAGRASRNLDGWMIGIEESRELFQRAAREADISVVEGVMGLFDGLADGSIRASSAEMARVLDLPVVLVLDVSRQGASAAATVYGFQRLDPAVRVAGVILNRVGSARHAALTGRAIEERCGISVLGAIPRDETMAIPERHLGLFTGAERSWGPVYERLAETVERFVDLGALLELARAVGPVRVVAPRLFAPVPGLEPCRVGVAWDEAFNFYYADNLGLLRHYGAEPVFFSPLRDPGIPPGVELLCFGGGYPELHAAALEANRAMLTSVREFAEGGGRIYGECGGLMYLGKGLTTLEGSYHAMAGVLPVRTRMAGGRLSLGYVTARAAMDTLVLSPGRAEDLRGHFFHYSEVEVLPGGTPCLSVRQAAGEGERRDGWQEGNVFASYLHVHFASAPDVLERLLGRGKP